MSPNHRLIQWRAALAGCIVTLLGACASTPPPPDWQMDAQGSLERAVDAWLSGRTRVADVEFDVALRETARTGRADLMARIALSRCAAERASLVLQPCAAFEPLAEDASDVERAYARYLQAKPEAADVELLPEAQRGVAEALLAGGPTEPAKTLAAIEEPISRLVAAGVLMQGSAIDPAGMDVAVETASQQGWTRPLLAWLGAQAALAEQAGEAEVAAALRRRMARIAPPEPGVTPR